jgi:hypothetical protein
MPPTRFAGVAEARAVHGDRQVDRALELVRLSDVPGDRLAAALQARGPAGWALLDRALAGEEAADAPPGLEAVVGPARRPPAWVDLDLVDAGAVATWRRGAVPSFLALLCGSLAFGYRSASLSRPLAATGRLTQMAPRRLAETSRWYVTATAPGALRPGGAGVDATVRLRVVHALVRAHLRRTWDVEGWGEPLSVADTLATGLGGFLLVPDAALTDLGVRQRAAEREAQFALWRYVSWLMGVPEAHLPDSLEDGAAWMACVLDLDAGPDEASPELMRALLRHGIALERFLPGPAAVVSRAVSHQVLGAFTRRWMGDPMADRLAVPDGPLKHLLPALRAATVAREALLATGVLGDDRAVAARELAVVGHVLRGVRAAPTVAPAQVADAPALRAA